ncbi:outer membrane lipoprotein-sorting protein [Bdellovibrionales bacterium]|nr:outer membrane lipoprotein-sorting protein [Bdellovibrionales bacterium]
MKSLFISTIIFGLVTTAQATDIKELPYPKGEPTALEIIQQNQFVDKFYGLSKMPIQYQPAGRAVLLTGPINGSLSQVFVERYINTNPTPKSFLSKELSIFLSGKNRAMAFLISDFAKEKSPMFQVWRPDLRKVRRMPAPLYDDRWGGSDFSWGEMLLQRPSFELHTLLKKSVFGRCLGFMKTKIPAPWSEGVSGGSCAQKERVVYLVKSVANRPFIHEYDYRIRYIDVQTFADYRTEYYKDGELIRTVEKSWGPMGMEDPRVQGWGYMYGHDLRNNHESVFLQVDRNTSHRPSGSRFWSEQTMRFLRR